MVSSSGAEGQSAFNGGEEMALLGASVDGEVGSGEQHNGGRLQVMSRGSSGRFLKMFADRVADGGPFRLAEHIAGMCKDRTGPEK